MTVITNKQKAEIRKNDRRKRLLKQMYLLLNKVESRIDFIIS